MIPFHIFFGDSYIGSGLRHHAFCDHYLCPTCGTIWARTYVDADAQHCAWSIHCPDHPAPFRCPATLFQEARYEKIIWPVEVLVRDFLYLMELISAPITHYNLPSIRDYNDSNQAA